MLSLFGQGVHVPKFWDTDFRTGGRLCSRGFRVPKFWDTDLRWPDTLAFTMSRVPKLWGTEFEPCPDHRYKDVRVPLATRLAIAFECAIWQLLTNPKIPHRAAHVITLSHVCSVTRPVGPVNYHVAEGEKRVRRGSS